MSVLHLTQQTHICARIILWMVLSLSITQVVHAHQSQSVDHLSNCLLQSTTAADKTTVLQWTFVALSAHPALQPYSQVSAEQRKNLDQNLAQVLQRILLEQCAAETRAVIQAEGLQAVGSSFQALGQATGAEILKTPEIKEQYKGVLRYLDWTKLAMTFLTPEFLQKIATVR